MASKAAPPSSERNFYGWVGHGVRVREQELVPSSVGKACVAGRDDDDDDGTVALIGWRWCR